MDLVRAISVFVRTVDAGSMASAARALDLSPAVVTRLLADLEDSLGVRLLHRTTRRLTLTNIGEAYLERARKILVELDDASDLARSAKADVEGVIKVAAPPAFAVHQLVKKLPLFYDTHPKACVELSIEDHVHVVKETHDVTVIVKGTAELGGEFIARPIARSELVVCATPSYFRKYGKPSHPTDVEHHEVVLPPVAHARREFPFYPRFAGESMVSSQPVFARPKTPRLASMHLDAVHAAVMGGVGLAALPSFVVADALREGVLERALAEWYLLSHSIFAAMPTRKHVPTRTRAFMDFLLQAFGGQESVDPWLEALGDSHSRAPAAVGGRVGFGLSRTPS